MSVEVADKEGLNLSGGVSQNDGQNDHQVRIIEEVKSLEILEPKNFLLSYTDEGWQMQGQKRRIKF